MMTQAVPPASGMLRMCRILEVVAHSPVLKSFLVPRLFDALPGQFVNLWLPGIDEKPFSISGIRETCMELSVKAVGPFTRRLIECAEGEWVGIRGPFGNGFPLEPGALLVGGGIGMAPIRFLAQMMAERGLPCTLVCGARTRADLIFEPELLRWGCHMSTDDGSCGTCGQVTDLLDGLMAEHPASAVCAAGPEPMLLRIMEFADRWSLPYHISFERYMKCGIGICGQCCVDGSGIRLCIEGPVLNRDQTRLVTEFGLPHRDASGLRPGTPASPLGKR
ncbi:MAG: dihydroorotate dehydrogenase electron transfer subunit [Candidatus Eisenbacteria bacterium]|nr:dihydroorotate dehydrogenase electron transfer subunit [Candidatus Eisenbacteria bacterium]